MYYSHILVFVSRSSCVTVSLSGGFFFKEIYVGQIHVKYVDWIHLFYTQESGILQVNVSELGLVTPAGKVVWGEYSFLHTQYYVFCRFLKLLLCLFF